MSTSRALLPLLKESDFDRFFSKVEAGGVCWQWTAAKQKGYGKFVVGGREGFTTNAHRVAWALLLQEEPGETLDHLCNNPSCVNPDHLSPATRAENVRRRDWFGPRDRKIVCPLGHTKVFKWGRLMCDPCMKKQRRDSYHRNKQTQSQV